MFEVSLPLSTSVTPPVNESTAGAKRSGVRSDRDKILTLDSRRVAAEREDHHIHECGDHHRCHDEVGVVRGCCVDARPWLAYTR
jgi:hypothetical protein